jgi:cutinase
MVTAALIAASVIAPSAYVFAASCPDVEVVFARGRLEPPGVGQVGDAFVGSLRSKLKGHSVGVYPVNYDANYLVQPGANDMSQHIQYMTSSCPNTRLVLGGYSLGAALTDVVISVPEPIFGFDNPLPATSDDHVAAVALFGNGTQRVLGAFSSFAPRYGDRVVEMCHRNDPICNDNNDPNTWQAAWPDHLADGYIKSGMVSQAADFVANKI